MGVTEPIEREREGDRWREGERERVHILSASLDQFVSALSVS
jgi:hypothetical protein